MTRGARTRHVLIVLPDQAHIMDVAGPAQVFTNAAELTDGGYTVGYVAARADVTTHQGLPLRAPTTWPTLKPEDLVIVVGWKTSATAARRDAGLDEALSAQVREHFITGGRVASVCAGALALADAGILAGRTATTHHDLLDQLHRHPGVDVARDVLFTCEPRLHTSAGIAAGIDLSLHLVTHDHGPALAARVARTLVVQAWRAGNTTQASILLIHRDHMDDLTHKAQDILDDPSRRPQTLTRLAGSLGVSSRTLTRHFTASTGLTPQAYATAVRRERATHLHDNGWTWQAAAQAVGYSDARSLRARTPAP